MAVTSTTQVDPEVARFFDGVLLDRHKPYFVFGYFGQKRRIPMKNSGQIICRRYDNLANAVTPLVQGVTPTAVPLSKFDVTINVQEFGNVITLTDTVVIQVQDQTVAETADILAQNMAGTYDQIIRDMLVASASQINCTAGVNGKLVAVLKPDLIDLELLAA